jgi:hypothetical protein
MIAPVDFDRCQVEKHNGYNFMTLGGRPGLERCIFRPTYLVHEKVADSENEQGSMSMCTECKDAFLIEYRHKILDYVFSSIIRGD